MRAMMAVMIVLAAAGAEAKHHGSAPCGGAKDAKCPERQFCKPKIAGKCAGDDNPGRCTPAPEMCAQDCPGVRGCDGKDYCNECIAEQAGTVAAPEPACTTNADCAAGSFCAGKGACPSSKRPGACAQKPQACPRIFKQVCGCDGKTWANGCDANAAGATVAHDGPCPPPEKDAPAHP